MQRVRSGMFVFFSTISLITLLLFGNVFLTNARSGDIPRVWTITPDMSTFLADTAIYTVTFNQAVTGVDATDFFVSDTDAQIDAIEAITPTEFRITVTHITTTNPPLLVLADDDTIVNNTGIPIGGVGHGNGNGVSNLATTHPLSTSTEHLLPENSLARSDTSAGPIARSPRSVLHKVGQNNSIALTADGTPVISYVDVTNSDLKLAICDDITCANPSISTLDSEYDVGYFSSLALTTNDIPVIGYYDVTHRSLKLAVCNNTACTSPTISTIDNSNSVGAYLDLVLTSDNKPVLSYLDSTNYDLMLAVCNNTACTSPTISRLDSDDMVGLNTSIALKSGNLPVISYHDATNTSLKLVICDDAACTSKTISTLDSADITGEYSSIAVTSDNKPIISYQNGTSGDLKLAICNNTACSSPLISTLDSANYVGLETSLGLTSDNDAIISYFDMTNGTIKIAKCDGIPCANPVIFTIDYSGAQGYHNSIAINTNDDFVVSYYDYDYGILKLHTASIIIDAGQPNSFAKSAPTNAQSVTTASTTLTWSSSTYADSYEYCIATSIAACTTWVSTGSTASATVTGLAHGATYYWQVRASNSSGTRLANSDSYYSFTVTLLPTSFAKSSPANNATRQSTSVTLAWAASTYATSYEYCIALTTATCTTWKSTGTARTATVTGLTKNKSYYWQVRAKNAGGTTLSATTYWKFTTAP